jgi:putative transposase
LKIPKDDAGRIAARSVLPTGAMTVPRRVLPGATYLVTRRCTQRQFLLRPSKVTNGVFRYLLALAAQRFGIEIHAYCVLSNHYHLVVTDRGARLPEFQQFLDALVARALNALLGRWEAFWGPDSFSAVALITPLDIVDKAAYALANPVAAGLVRSARRWPGLWSSPEALGDEAVQVPRPVHFFDPRGGLPESAPLRLSAPPGFPTAKAFRQQLSNALAALEAEAVRRATGFVGVARVLSVRTTARPKTREPRRGLNPRVASRSVTARIEALAALASFVSRYRSALREWREGRRGALFPAGTYLMRVLHGAACTGAG